MALDWVEGCHDASVDGGLPGRYRLRDGWSGSYPETTGYAVPTLLRAADRYGRPGLADRAGRCVDFLLAQQASEGWFAGGEVGASPARASVFNTAQVLSGLDAWDAAREDARARDAAARAADWLLSVQDDDGAWRAHTYGGVACAYYAHASCWLARLGARLGEPRYTRAAARHVTWVLGCRAGPSGWLETAGFPSDHARRAALTHTLGYTLWGLIVAGQALGAPEAAEAARSAARAIAHVLERWGWLPATLDADWRPCADYACLTGNAQLSQVWRWLAAEDDEDGLMTRAAEASLRLCLAAQPVWARERGVRGGIPGSAPLWGDYLPNAFPNWAAKFAIDAVLDATAS